MTPKRRVIFVGVHNKPGMDALDSKSRSGKLIDRVIASLGTNEFHFIKSNLYNLEEFPNNRKRELDIAWVQNWRERVGLQGIDIVVTLGQTVNTVFRWAKQPSIKVGHPSGVWSHEKQKEYVKRTACLILEEHI